MRRDSQPPLPLISGTGSSKNQYYLKIFSLPPRLAPQGSRYFSCAMVDFSYIQGNSPPTLSPNAPLFVATVLRGTREGFHHCSSVANEVHLYRLWYDLEVLVPNFYSTQILVYWKFSSCYDKFLRPDTQKRSYCKRGRLSFDEYKRV